MRSTIISVLGLVLVSSIWSNGAEFIITVGDDAAAAREHAAPVLLEIDLAKLSSGRVDPAKLRLVERWREEGKRQPIPVQFESDADGSEKGTLWWLLPPSPEQERHLRLSLADDKVAPVLAIGHDVVRQHFEISESGQAILRYCQGSVPVPSGIDTNYARGDYIIPLLGPRGEVLTDDYPKDHPHHRGVSWSWPVTRWGNEVRDIWAVRGVWARPAAVRRLESGPVFALLEVENVWKWGDTVPIVREDVAIRTFRQSQSGRLIDIEVRLTALVDGVAIGGRPQGGYGGFGLRAMPAQRRVIALHTDPLGSTPRRSWLDYSGVFPGGQEIVGVAIFEHTANLFYPNTLLQYPDLNYVMPAFPGEREVPLSKEKALVLRHRLWVHPGAGDTPRLAAIWAAYAHPPKARLESN